MKLQKFLLRKKAGIQIPIFRYMRLMTTILIGCITFISCSEPKSKIASNSSDEYFVRPCEFICDYPYNDTTKWEITCRVWGLLKYYHPNVTAGKHDWDKVLLDGLENIHQASTSEMLNMELKKMINAAGKYKYIKSSDLEDSDKMNIDLCWLEQSFLDDELQDELRKIASITVEQPSYYSIQFDQTLIQNEKEYDLEVSPSLDSMKYRLLSFFRYWNVIYYFFPHKYLMDRSWDKILSESVFRFIDATDDQAYKIAFLKLAAALNDGHGYITMAGNYSPESTDIVETVEGKTVMRVDAGTLKKGDIVNSVDQRDIQCIRDSLSVLTSASTSLNKEYRINCHIAEMIFFPGTRMTVWRDGKEMQLYQVPVTFKKKDSSSHKWLSDEIGYVDFSALTKDRIDSVFQDFSNADGIIFDLRKGVERSYDASRFSHYLSEPNTPYNLFSIVLPDLEHPGAFLWSNITGYTTGEALYPRFKGKIVYLINESSQSGLETIAWVGRSNFGVILIGRPTSGALGRVTWIPLPGKDARAAFSNFALFSSDGIGLQRKGIIPDIEVYPTMESIIAGEDEILNSAVEYLSNH